MNDLSNIHAKISDAIQEKHGITWVNIKVEFYVKQQLFSTLIDTPKTIGIKRPNIALYILDHAVR